MLWKSSCKIEIFCSSSVRENLPVKPCRRASFFKEKILKLSVIGLFWFLFLFESFEISYIYIFKNLFTSPNFLTFVIKLVHNSFSLFFKSGTSISLSFIFCLFSFFLSFFVPLARVLSILLMFIKIPLWPYWFCLSICVFNLYFYCL